MSDYFLGEIRFFPYDRIPSGWQPCEGQLMQIRQNTALYSLIGRVYGGDGVNTFALPDLRGAVPMCTGPLNPLGAAGGEAAHTLTINEMPQHTHQITASENSPSQISPANNTWSALGSAYELQPNVQMAAQALEPSGGSQAHNNMQPYLTLRLCISTTGLYPSRP